MSNPPEHPEEQTPPGRPDPIVPPAPPGAVPPFPTPPDAVPPGFPPPGQYAHSQQPPYGQQPSHGPHGQPSYAEPPAYGQPPYGPPGHPAYPSAYPAPPTPPRQLGGVPFGWGVAIGLIGSIILQVVVSVVTFSTGFGLSLPLPGFLLLIIAGTVLTSIRSTRSFGVGALISIATAPIIFFGVCIAVLSGI